MLQLITIGQDATPILNFINFRYQSTIGRKCNDLLKHKDDSSTAPITRIYSISSCNNKTERNKRFVRLIMLEQISSDKSDISARHQAPRCVQLVTYFCSVERDLVVFYAHSVVRKIQSPTHAAQSYSGKRLPQHYNRKQIKKVFPL